MLEWLFDKGVTYLLGLFVFGLIYPIYKSGFYIRQGLVYRRDCLEAESKMAAKGLTINNFPPEICAGYLKQQRTYILMLTVAPIFVAILFFILLYFGYYLLAMLIPCMAVIGYINVKD